MAVVVEATEVTARVANETIFLMNVNLSKFIEEGFRAGLARQEKTLNEYDLWSDKFLDDYDALVDAILQEANRAGETLALKRRSEFMQWLPANVVIRSSEALRAYETLQYTLYALTRGIENPLTRRSRDFTERFEAHLKELPSVIWKL